MDAKLSTGAWGMTTGPGLHYVSIELTFEDLYRAEYSGLVAVAAALTGDFRASEDLVQDTMVKAFVRWSWVCQLGRPGAWCHRVLTNACRDWARRRRLEDRITRRYRQRDLVTNGPSPDAIAFWAAVRTLPTRPRSVMVLFYAADRTVAEIASILDVPDGTVRSDLSRARLALARDLGVLS